MYLRQPFFSGAHCHIFQWYWAVLLLLCLPKALPAQKYNFINFNVENGLAQSQATVFAQNQNNELLIGTYGGLSVFDGSNFTNYNKNKGLPHNIVNAIAFDQKQTVWIGTSNAISRFDGKKFKTIYPSDSRQDGYQVNQILVDGHGQVWALLADHNLYKFNGQKFIKEKEQDTINSITLDKSGNLWIANYRGGVDVYNGSKRHREINYDSGSGLVIYNMTFGAYSGTLYCLSTKGILIAEKGKFKSPDFLKTLPHKGFPNNILEDNKGNIWLSLNDGGAWVYSQKKWIHYTYKNGLTDDNIDNFYEDIEGNIWLSTNGSGIFRYTGSIFIYYDRGTGLLSPSIMSIAQSRNGAIHFASSNSGLYELTIDGPVRMALPSYASRVNSIITDTLGKLWIGTNNAGLWCYDGEKMEAFHQSLTLRISGISNLHRYHNTIWISSRVGLYSLKNDSITRENIPPGTVIYTSCALNEDSLLIGTLKGAYIYRTDLKRLMPKPLLPNATTLCFAYDSKHVYIGTDDRGLVIWDRTKNTFSSVNQNSGLSCDYIYSILRDRNGYIWVGTGCGIDRISFEKNNIGIKSFGKSDGLLGVESNANASFEDREGFLWFGTTRGVFRYNPYVTFAEQQAPKVILQSVKLFSKDIPYGIYSDSLIPLSTLLWNPVLPTSQNHLTFTFKGVYLSNPEKVRYRYQLVGTDKNFTETNQTTVVYPNLPPGEYLFKVWASDPDGKWYENAVSYPFVINAPYYTTWYFRVGLALFLIGLFFGSVYYRTNQKEKSRKWEEKLREEEQAVVRKKTAEDFHDEIGNKLTRINLLATIAEGKLQPPATEVKNILHQIQNNVASLYNGSKDIIWSLQPESDYLDEILFRIQQNISELLQDGHMHFHYIQSPELHAHLKLPIDYSRNMIMIFKEATNNVVKHAKAKNIYLRVTKNDEQIFFELQDDGIGFDYDMIHSGNGLSNITNRAKRIGASIKFASKSGIGTTLYLTLSI